MIDSAERLLCGPVVDAGCAAEDPRRTSSTPTLPRPTAKPADRAPERDGSPPAARRACHAVHTAASEDCVAFFGSASLASSTATALLAGPWLWYRPHPKWPAADNAATAAVALDVGRDLQFTDHQRLDLPGEEHPGLLADRPVLCVERRNRRVRRAGRQLAARISPDGHRYGCSKMLCCSVSEVSAWPPVMIR